MALNRETGKHEIREAQAKQILKWLAGPGAVNYWEEKDRNRSPFTSEDDQRCWYLGGDFDWKSQPLDPPDSTLTSIDDFVVLVFEEVFRRTLPAAARPGVQLSDEMIEAYTADFEKHFDQKIGPKYDERGSRFGIEPNKKKPWLYDGVVYVVTKTLPLREYAGREGVG